MSGLDAMVSSRRGFLGLAGGSAALLALGSAPAQAARVKTGAKIVILGAGAAGTALANRLVDRLEGAKITLLDARKQHLYQPGFTLIAAGLKPVGYSISATKDWLPQGVTLIEEAAAEIDPVARTVTSAGGTVLAYDFLVVATGLKLDYDAIPGMSLDLVGSNGLGSVYAGPEHAAKT